MCKRERRKYHNEGESGLGEGKGAGLCQYLGPELRNSKVWLMDSWMVRQTNKDGRI